MTKLVPWNKNPLEIGDVPVAIISLSDAKARRATLIERGFTPELVNGFWSACDMRGLADSELQPYSQYHDIKKLYGRPPVSAELGCFFSHSAIIKWLSEQDTISQIIVFEDDVVPEAFSNFEKLTGLVNALAEVADSGKSFICHLGPRPAQWELAFTRKISKNSANVPGLDLFDFVDKKARLWRAHAYIMSKGAADRYTQIVNQTGFLADDWHFIADQTMSRLIIANPPLFTQDEEVESTIDPENKRILIMNSANASRKKFGLLDGLKFFRIFRKCKIFFKRFIKYLLVSFYRALPGRSIY
jgi:GR25 family glycosyltransferase involved in LPS biosynthesis